MSKIRNLAIEIAYETVDAERNGLMSLRGRLFSDVPSFKLIVAEAERMEAELADVRKAARGAQALIAALNRKLAALEGQQGEPVAPERYAPYGIIDPDYARVYTQARIIAWQYGYACLLHGSFTRDLDLLMAPWTEQARGNGEQILKLIAQACNLRFKDGEEDILKSKADWSEKPHGRKACSLYFPRFGDCRWIDVSFVPLAVAAGARE